MYTEEDLAKYKLERANFKKAAEKLNKECNKLYIRCEEISKLIFKAFGSKGHSVGDVDTEYIDSPQFPSGEEEFHYPLVVNGKPLLCWDWDYSQGFPVQFLFMTNKEVTACLKGNIKESKAQEAFAKEQEAKETLKNKKKLLAQLKKELGEK